MTSFTRGPLPARVYWTRRLLVLGTALVLVLAIARMLTGGSDATSEPQAAQVAAAAAAQESTAVTPTPPAVTPTTPAAGKGRHPGRARSSQAPVLAAPTGPCSDEDVAVEPDVRHPVAGRDVTFKLRLRTISSPACTWRVSHDTVTLKITSGADDIWSSRQCPRAIPTQDVVLRDNVTTSVKVTWDAKRSDDTCSVRTEWAMPGFYHVAAAALAGEPADQQFRLEAPTGAVVTLSPSPTPQAPHSSGRPVTKPSGKAD